MPTYDYRCTICDFTCELVVKIDDRDKPTQEPCPNCRTQTIVREIAAPLPTYTTRGPNVPDSFKDVLRNIKSKHRHSTIDV